MEKPEENIEEVITGSDLPSLSKELTEVAVDSILKEGVLKDLPVVNIIVGGINFGSSVNKYFFTKKIHQFLFQLTEVPEEARLQKIKEINGSGKYRSKVGESILELIDKIESDHKPEIIGRLFKAVLLEQIDYENYLSLASIIKNMFIADILWLKKQYPGGDFEKQIEINTGSPLLTSGLLIDELMNANGTSAAKDGEGTVTYRRPSILGRILIDIGLE